MFLSTEQLRKYLTENGHVSKQVFDTALTDATEKNMSVGELLFERGEVQEGELRRAYAYVSGIPFVSLVDKKIPYETLSVIPEPVARHSNIVAYERTPESLSVALLDPGDIQSIEFIRKKTGLRISTAITDTASIKDILKQYQKSLKADLGDLISSEAAQLVVESQKGGEPAGDDAKKMAERIPTVRVVDALLRHSISQGASDIHIEHHEREILVRYRIDGILRDAMTLPALAGPAIVARLKVLANLRLDEKRLPQDGRFKIDDNGEKVSFRVSTLPTHYGEKIVMRLLREGGGGFSLESLGFHGLGLDRVHRALRKKTGIILITGPTGSGKTTTLYTLLDILNTPEVNISTIEDPIEYQMPRVNQTQVRPEIGLTFANGLRTLMRQDPDIIMIGEIRDQETANLAINAALTGHLVLATLHTNSAAGAIPRLLDMGVEPFLLVSTIQIIMGQRLVRTLHSKHGEESLPLTEIATLEKQCDLGLILKTLKEEKLVAQDVIVKDIPFGKPTPSPESESGYAGRKSIIEVLEVSSAIKELVAKRASSDEIQAQARSEGMLTMLEDGVVKAASKMTSLEEVLRVISE
jgi:type IV pilus assembly protein PilB